MWLHHLGIGLYSNVPAVQSELVANAWDADGTGIMINLLGRKTVNHVRLIPDRRSLSQ